MARHAAFILAKRGSVGLPHKNLMSLGGIGLFERTVDQMRAADAFTHILLSTNCPDLAHRAEAYGVDVLLRDDALAANDRYIDSVNGAVSHLLDREDFTHFTLAQIVQPMRSASLFCNVLAKHADGIDSVVTVRQFESSIAWLYRAGANGNLLAPTEVGPSSVIGRENNLYEIDNNIVSFTRASWEKSIGISPCGITPWPYLGENISYISSNYLNPNFNIDINNPEDMEWAEFLLTFESWRANRAG